MCIVLLSVVVLVPISIPLYTLDINLFNCALWKKVSGALLQSELLAFVETLF